MADASYPLGGQGCYQAQGGNSWVVGSTGTLTVEPGGTLAFETGTTLSIAYPLTIASGGAIVAQDGGQIVQPVTTQATSAGTITNYGVTTFGSTSVNAYTLTAPTRAGYRKTLIYQTGGSSDMDATVTTATTNSYIRNTTAVAGDTHTITFAEAGAWCRLVSVTTAEWRVLSSSNVAIT